MKIWYIKQIDSIDEICKKAGFKTSFCGRIIKQLTYITKRMFNILTLKETEYGILCILPISGCEDKKNKENKLAKKLNKIVKLKTIVLSEYLRKNETFTKELSNLEILNGKWLFKYLLYDSLEYISEKQRLPLEVQEISILINEVNDTNLQNIIRIAKKVKVLNIITNNMNKINSTKNYLYDSFGIPIHVTKSSKISSKTTIIINFDFTQEQINKLEMPKKAIIINVGKEIRIKKKKFNGVVVNDYDVELDKKLLENFERNGLLKYFNKKELYESTIFTKNSYKTIVEWVKRDKTKVLELIGTNGVINEKEYI